MAFGFLRQSDTGEWGQRKGNVLIGTCFWCTIFRMVGVGSSVINNPGTLSRALTVRRIVGVLNGRPVPRSVGAFPMWMTRTAHHQRRQLRRDLHHCQLACDAWVPAISSKLPWREGSSAGLAWQVTRHYRRKCMRVAQSPIRQVGDLQGTSFGEIVLHGLSF